MSFDNEAELHKIAAVYAEAKLLLRIVCEDSMAQCPMSLKFGAQHRDCAALLSVARDVGLDVVGISFHVGSGCKDPTSFEKALSDAGEIFALATSLGFSMKLLDIGGGFPGARADNSVDFKDIAKVISDQLKRQFSADRFPDLRIIAEPGRFFASSCASLLTKVFAKSEVHEDDQGESSFRYYVNDGLYGSFNCVLYDHASVMPEICSSKTRDAPLGPDRHCCIFGPTCDGFDVVMKEHAMPELQEGDWLLWRDMGAYTSAAGSKFNGFSQAKVWYYDDGLVANWNISERR
jgi:ornithine decarboxylase